MTEYVCIDIGGTALKYGLADAAVKKQINDAAGKAIAGAAAAVR